MRKLSKGLLVVASLVAAPSLPDSLNIATRIADHRPLPDPRLCRLLQYFGERGCPAQTLAADFLEASDDYNLDWRLLPSISMVESSGGKACKNNNILGWKNCERKFASAREGIRIVAYRLAKSKLYRDKDLTHLLRTYNPRHKSYTLLVRSVMRALGPDGMPAPQPLPY